MNVKEAGFRRDLKALFKVSGMFGGMVLKHSAFIVAEGDEISICRNSNELAHYAPEADVVVSWQGKWNSDYFHFKVSDFIEWQNEQEKSE